MIQKVCFISNDEFNDIDKNPLTEGYLQKAQVRIIPEVWP